MALQLAWLGDDFTGASDTLATLARAGLRARLFLAVPDATALADAGSLDAIGIASAARSLAPAAMRDAIAPAVHFLAMCGAPVLHYKVCSTFDSAPTVGNIGEAVRMFRAAGVTSPVLIVGGQPSLGRYCAFGQLFAAVAPGGAVVRIDRHPTMAHHPVTPMSEADLCVHLAQQGLADVALFDLRDQARPRDEAAERLAAIDAEAVLVDVTEDAHLRVVADVLWGEGKGARRGPRVAVGASSVAQALVDARGLTRDAHDPPLAPAVGPVLVLAGSLSPRTAWQVANASSYEKLMLDPTALCDGETHLEAIVEAAVDRLRGGRHVLVHTPPRAQADAPALAALAPRCGELLRRVWRGAHAAGVPLARLGVAGGDTSSHAVQALAPDALDWIARVDDGVALCRAVSRDPRLHGLEWMLKGGQLGAVDLFERLVTGRN